MTEPTLEETRNWVMSLMIQCPMGAPLDDCPANEARGLPLEDLVKVIADMSEHDLNAIIAHHRECLRRREGRRSRLARYSEAV